MRVVSASDALANEMASVRLDVWLWAARLFRSRALAKQAIETGNVEVDGQRAKASRSVRVGNAIRVVRSGEGFDLVVLGTSEDRGPASVAQTLYEESEASRLVRETLRAEQRAARAGYRAPDGKPDKRARRLIRALGDFDAL